MVCWVGRKGKTAQYDPIYVKKKNIKQFLYPDTNHIYIHTDAHQTHKDTPDTQNVYTETHITHIHTLTFYLISVFTNIKLVSVLCFIFSSIGLKLYTPFVFFYWLSLFYS